MLCTDEGGLLDELVIAMQYTYPTSDKTVDTTKVDFVASTCDCNMAGATNGVKVAISILAKVLSAY